MANKKYIIHILFFLALIALFTWFSFCLKNLHHIDLSDYITDDYIEKTLSEKYKYLTEKNEKIIEKIKKNPRFFDVKFFDSVADDYLTSKVGFFHYENGKLSHWSTNDIPVPTDFDTCLTKRLVSLANGLYMSSIACDSSTVVVGLFQIKKEYSYDNDFLTETFTEDLHLPSMISVSTKDTVGAVSIKLPNSSEKLYFDIHSENFVQDRLSVPQLMKCLLLFVVAFFLFFLFNLLTKKYEKYSWVTALLFFLALFSVKYLFYAINYFEGFEAMKLFAPELYSWSFLQSSFADLLINVFLFSIAATFFYFKFNFKIQKDNFDFKGKFFVTSIVALIFILFTYFLDSFLSGIVLNSSISFDFSNISDLNEYSYIGIIASVILFLSSLLIMWRITHNLTLGIDIRVFAVEMLLLMLAFVLLKSSENSIVLQGVFFYLLWLSFIFLEIKNKNTYIFNLLIIILISAVISHDLARNYSQKENDSYKVLAYNLSAERDFDAESYFSSLNEEIRSNEKILEAVKNYKFGIADSLTFDCLLSKKYLQKYDIQTTICLDSDSLYFEPEDVSVGCFSYFKEQILDYGVIIPNTNFYFLDNYDGRLSYLGVISILVEPSVFAKIYIELSSRIFSEGLGYPDLLLDKKLLLKQNNRNNNFAKYNNGVLIASRGSYRYLYSLSPEVEGKEYSVIKKDGYVHFMYCPDKDNAVILSKRDTQYSNGFISLFFVSVMLFLIFNISLLVKKIHGKYNPSFTNNLDFKIRLSFISVLIFCLLVTIFISIYYIVDSYEQRKKESVFDKVQSVSVEMERSLNVDDIKLENLSYLDEMLVYLSNILYVDINIYDTKGLLLSSSRKEFFDKGLKGMYMDPTSYKHLIVYRDEMYVHEEVIDKVKYMSVYVPFKNKDKEVVAYLNLPYFSGDSELKGEMSNYIAAFASIFLLLIAITLTIGYIVSRQVTIPLAMLQDSICGMDINKADKIKYNRDDEIGKLIREYNKKVDELSESAQKLALSERESAWREMAKQIAHEIKNPLTPMKLNIQYLERAYNNHVEGWEDMYKKVSKTLIEQIDVLSAVASQFSDFAKMQIPQKSDINIREIIDSIVLLYKNTENIKIVVTDELTKNPIISADKDQMIRVFSNLLKNSIQAILPEKEGLIMIKIDEESEKYVVSVKDNGCGMDEETRAKIFQPNFTTKSSGMGLGLSMVKNILMGNNAEISFETELGVGTEFKLYFFKLNTSI